MKKTALLWIVCSWVLIATALTSACSDHAPTAATTSRLAAADLSNGNRFPDLTGCEHLAAPDGSTLVLRAFGIGVQIHHWNGTSWGTATPSATLYADVGGAVSAPTWGTPAAPTLGAAD